MSKNKDEYTSEVLKAGVKFKKVIIVYFERGYVHNSRVKGSLGG